MPVNRKPILEYWLDTAKEIGSRTVLVNTHYLAEIVEVFLGRATFTPWVKSVYEDRLMGTAGTLRVNSQLLRSSTILLAHADNFCECDFSDFLRFHRTKRPEHCALTMMTFYTKTPHDCGIVELDKDGVVIRFHEKVKDAPGNLANGAVYLLEEEVLSWICERPNISDFSTQVLPHFIGRIATWHNKGTHIDIGSIEALRDASNLAKRGAQPLSKSDGWAVWFDDHPIHEQLGLCNEPQLQEGSSIP
jgi:mannose-1-phosphate guanylyltransferase